jgi:Na+-driven multidrug efflux pump
MTPRITFLICSAVGLFFAVAFCLAPKFFTHQAWPTAEGQALEIAVTMRYVVAAMIFHVSLLLFAASKVVGAGNQKPVMLSSAIGFTIVCATILYVGLFRGDGVPTIPPIVGTGILAILCWLSWSKTKISTI